MTGRHALLLEGRERNASVLHAERFRDAASYQTLIIYPGAVREDVAKQPRAQV